MLKLLTFILAGILAVLVLLYFMPIQIKLKTIRKNEDDIILIRIKMLYGIVNLKFELPFFDIVLVNNKLALKYKAEFESNKTSKLFKKISKIFTIEDFNNIKKYFRHDPVLFHRLKDYWADKIIINNFSLIIKFGFKDATLVALLYGILWTIIGSVLSILSNKIKFSTEDIVITPYFDKDLLNIEFSCIIKFSLGNIINTGIMVLKRRGEIKKIEAGHKNIYNAG